MVWTVPVSPAVPPSVKATSQAIPFCATAVRFRRAMAKQESIVLEGVVRDVLPDRNYRVELENGHIILAYTTGKMSKFRIRVLVGDRVTVEVSPYDFSRGRITFRHKIGDAPGGAPPSRSGRR